MTDLAADHKALAAFRPLNKVRFITAASLFDGHDAAIHIMRRILQGMGAEVVHLGHNRSVDEVVTAACRKTCKALRSAATRAATSSISATWCSYCANAAARTSRCLAAAAVSSCRPRCNCWPRKACASTPRKTASAWACKA